MHSLAPEAVVAVSSADAENLGVMNEENVCLTLHKREHVLKLQILEGIPAGVALVRVGQVAGGISSLPQWGVLTQAKLHDVGKSV